MKNAIFILLISIFGLPLLAQSDPSLMITTTIEFEQEEFQFGTITEGEIIKTVVRFKNSGKHPLVIVDAKASCGCTVPEFPTDPIAPGRSASILVEFNSTGKQGDQIKRVTLTANTDPAQSYLTIKGKVEPRADLKIEDPKPVMNDTNQAIDENFYSISPNPTSNEVTLNFHNENIQGTLEIYNNIGGLIHSQAITGSHTKIDATSYPSGVYTISVKTGNKKKLAKQFVVKH